MARIQDEGLSASHTAYFRALRLALRHDAITSTGDANVDEMLVYADQLLENLSISGSKASLDEEYSKELKPFASCFGSTEFNDRPRVGAAEWLSALCYEGEGAVSPGAREVIGAIVNCEERRMEQIDQLLNDEKTWSAGTGVGETVDCAKLNEYLKSQAGVIGEARVRSIKRLPGGRSKITSMIELEPGSKLPQSLVMRQDTVCRVGKSVVDEYPLLCGLWDRGIPVPQPFLLQPQVSAVGQPFIILSRVAGENVGDLWGTTKVAPGVGESMARALAQIHQLDPDDLTVPNAIRGLSPRDTMLELMRQYQTDVDNQRFGRSPMGALGFLWLRENLDRGVARRGLVHGDVGFHNMLFEGSEVSAILDWELAHVGDPAIDLAYCKESVEQVMEWSDFIRIYERSGGHKVTPFQIKYFTVWRAVRNIVLCLRCADSFVRGETRDLGMGAGAIWAMPRFERLLLQLIGSDYSISRDRLADQTRSGLQ